MSLQTSCLSEPSMTVTTFDKDQISLQTHEHSGTFIAANIFDADHLRLQSFAIIFKADIALLFGSYHNLIVPCITFPKTTCHQHKLYITEITSSSTSFASPMT